MLVSEKAAEPKAYSFENRRKIKKMKENGLLFSKILDKQER